MNAAQQMEVFEILMYVSMAIAVVGLGLAIFFFFYFDIRSVYALMSGKAKRETIERMADQNSRTGHLKMDTGGLTSGSLNERSGSLVQHPSHVAPADICNTDQLPSQSEERGETTILNEVEQTTVLSGEIKPLEDDDGAGETRILSAPVQPMHESESAYIPSPAFRFDITESTLVIHTNEIL